MNMMISFDETKGIQRDTLTGLAVVRGYLNEVVSAQQEHITWIITGLKSRKPCFSQKVHDHAEFVRETLFQHLFELVPVTKRFCRSNEASQAQSLLESRFSCYLNPRDNPCLWEIHWLQAAYVALSRIVSEYVVLHAAAQVCGLSDLGELSLRHLNHVQRLAQETRQKMPAFVVDGLGISRHNGTVNQTGFESIADD